MCLSKTSVDSTVRVLSLSRFCPDFLKIVPGVCLQSGFCPDFLSGVCLSGFSLSRFCPLSGFCSDFYKKRLSDVFLSGFCLSRFSILSGIFEQTLSVVCLPGRTRTRQSCSDFRCPCPPTSGLSDN